VAALACRQAEIAVTAKEHADHILVSALWELQALNFAAVICRQQWIECAGELAFFYQHRYNMKPLETAPMAMMMRPTGMGTGMGTGTMGHSGLTH
jgi:hypothetical protein